MRPLDLSHGFGPDFVEVQSTTIVTEGDRRRHCPPCSTVMAIVPVAGLPAADRSALPSIPWATALQQVFERRCHAIEHTPVHFNRSANDIEFDLLARFLGSLAWTTPYRRSGCHQTPPCGYAASRATHAPDVPGRPDHPRYPAPVRKLRCTVATSFTDSAIMRVSSCTRVNRSNSSGSKPCAASLVCARRDCICDSAYNSIVTQLLA